MATASQSLFNMTVAGDNAGGNQGLLMPKLQYRFRVNFINFGVDAVGGLSLTKQVVDCARPTVSWDQIALPVYNSTIKLAGKHQWQDISVTVRDDASGSVAKAVGQQLQKQLDFVEQASAAAGQDYKFQTDIEILDGGNGTSAPEVLETWELYGCWVKTANYQTLNYGASEAVTIQLTICFDNAIQSPLTSGVGAPIGRILSGDSATGIGSANG
jgi:preprotein translocase subunit SecD